MCARVHYLASSHVAPQGALRQFIHPREWSLITGRGGATKREGGGT